MPGRLARDASPAAPARSCPTCRSRARAAPRGAARARRAAARRAVCDAAARASAHEAAQRRAGRASTGRSDRGREDRRRARARGQGRRHARGRHQERASTRPRSGWSVPAATTSRCARSRASPNPSAPSSSGCRCSSRPRAPPATPAAVPVEVQIVSRARPSSEKASPKDRHDHAAGHDGDDAAGAGVRRHARAVRHGPVRCRCEAPARARAAAFSGPRDRGWAVATAQTMSVSSGPPARRQGEGRTGFRTLVAGEAPGRRRQTAIELARQLARLGRQDDPARLEPRRGWPRGRTRRVTRARHHRRAVGTRLLRGRDHAAIAAREAHVIAAGSSVAGTAAAKDKDRVEHAAGCARRRLRPCGHHGRRAGRA